MADFDVIVVGAGLGGLSAASLLAQRGQRVLVLDSHNQPGGYATNFSRGDFTFDASLHSFDGVVEGARSFEVIKACGVAERVEFLPHSNLYRLVSGDIDLRVAHRNLPRYISQLSELFPEEADNIRRLFGETERMYRETADFLFSNRPFLLRMLATPFIYHRLLRYERDTVDSFFSRFTVNERLKALLAAQWTYFGLPPRKLAFPYFSYAFIDYLKNGGYSIRGGSRQLSVALRDVVEEHGGQVTLSSPVTSINVERGRATGVTTRKLGKVTAPVVISNVSPHAVVQLAGPSAFTDKFHAKLSSLRQSVSGFQVYLGLDCPLADIGVDPNEYIVFFSENPDLDDQYGRIMAGDIGEAKTNWSLNFFSNIDPSLAPPGKSTLGIFSLLSGSRWQLQSKAQYRDEKRDIADLLVSQAERRLPGLTRHIEVMEAGSPRTMRKFTSNPNGCIYGFEQTPDQSGLFHRFPQRYPIKGLFQVGAWTFPGGGFIATMLSAKILVDRYFRRAKAAPGRIARGPTRDPAESALRSKTALVREQ